MAVDIVMPQMGESIFEGTITKWLKKPGDKVERDEPLFEISTDKVDAEIPSPSAGVLKEIKVAEGKTVPIQTVVGVIDAAGDASAAKPAQPAASPKSEVPPAKAAQTPPSRIAAPPQAPANGKGVPAAIFMAGSSNTAGRRSGTSYMPKQCLSSFLSFAQSFCKYFGMRLHRVGIEPTTQ